MAVLTTPCPALFHKPPQAFPDRLALDDPVALACFAPIVGKSEKVKCTRAPCRLVAAWRPLERNQRRFLRMNSEAETGEAFRQDCHNPAGIDFALTADDKIIGTAAQKTSALHPGVDVLDQPFVQDMMQEYIGEHGRNDPALRRPLVGVQQRSRLQHARVQPLANQSEYSSITDSLLDKLPQMAPVQVVEKSTDIRIDYPVDVQRPTLLTQFVQRLMGTVPLPEAMGEGMEIFLEDRLQDHHHRPLDDLVLEAGFPYGPLLPIVLLDPHPLDGRRHIPIVAEPLMQVPQVLVQTLGVLLGRNVVHAWSTALLGLVIGFPQELPVDQVKHIVEHHGRIAPGLLCNSLEFHGYGW